MPHYLTTMGTIHAGLAFAGIVLGLAQFLSAKGTRAHRALGYAYVYGMVLADGTALAIYRFTGSFNIFHVGAIANLVCIVLAMVPVLRDPRPVDWKVRHYRWICGSYVGLVAAAVTELAVRMMPLSSRGQGWIVSAAAALVVTAIGVVAIRRYRYLAAPNPAPRDPPGAAMAADLP
jgi:uncharacterized membrane protein